MKKLIVFTIFTVISFSSYAQLSPQSPAAAIEYYDVGVDMGMNSNWFALYKQPYHWSYLNDANGNQFKNRFFGLNLMAGRKPSNKKYLNFIFGIDLNQGSTETVSPTDPSLQLTRRSSNIGGNIGYTITHNEKEITTISCDLAWGTDSYTDYGTTNRDFSKSSGGFRHGISATHINQVWNNRTNAHPFSGKIFVNAQASRMETDLTISQIFSAGLIAYPFSFGKTNTAGPYVSGEYNTTFDYQQKYFEFGLKSSFVKGAVNLSAGMKYYKIEDILENTEYTGGCSFNITAGMDVGVLTGFFNALIHDELDDFKF